MCSLIALNAGLGNPSEQENAKSTLHKFSYFVIHYVIRYLLTFFSLQ